LASGTTRSWRAVHDRDRNRDLRRQPVLPAFGGAKARKVYGEQAGVLGQ
jgi:hypothetical protein